MFEAIVVFCALGVTDPSECVTAEDTRGPYETREECMMRVHQMVSTLAMTMPVPMQYSFKCEEPAPKGIKL